LDQSCYNAGPMDVDHDKSSSGTAVAFSEEDNSEDEAGDADKGEGETARGLVESAGDGLKDAGDKSQGETEVENGKDLIMSGERVDTSFEKFVLGKDGE